MGKAEILLRELLSACVSVGLHAGNVIREVVHQDVDLGLVNKADGVYDPQTIADRRSQQRIIHAIRQVWPHIQIVGEEGDLDHPDAEDIVVADTGYLQDIKYSVPEALETLEIDRLVLWIDPLDGTKKFAAKKFDEVSVLIGISYDMRPIAGVMHLPFHGEHGTTYWGGRIIGVNKCVHVKEPSVACHVVVPKPITEFPSRYLNITTSGTNCELVNQALKMIQPGNVILGGATGTMILTIINGLSDTFFRFRKNTKRWDICPLEAFIEAFGGRVTDRYGRLYEFDPLGDESFDNEFGLLAYVDEEVREKMMNIMSCIDFTTTLDGKFFSNEWLSKTLNRTVREFEVIPDSIKRGKQSVVGQIDVTLKNGEKRHIFLKKIVKHELPSRSEAKWRRDMKSYQNEAQFYTQIYPELHEKVSAAQVYSVQSEQDAYLIFLGNVGAEHQQLDRLSVDYTKKGLEYLANLHAEGWNRPELLEKVQKELWSSGGWWQYEKRGLDELGDVPMIWGEFKTNFASITPAGYMERDGISSLSERMMEHVVYITEALFSKDSHQWYTLIHGDFKSSNLFFDKSNGQVLACDWQWSGSGLGALDVAYFLNTSSSIDALSVETEEELLKFYFEKFDQKCRGIDRGYNFDMFKLHYLLGTLEYARVLISFFWKNMTPESCEAKSTHRNCGLGYRSIPHVIRMVDRMDIILRLVEEERSVKSSQ